MADIAAAWRRVERALRRRPQTAVHADVPAKAHWTGGTKVVSTHVSGAQFLTDMPEELGGDGTAVTPGWLVRAGLASCAATTIAMKAAVEGIELATLEVTASSHSDARGLLGMTDADGKRINAGPHAMLLQVRIAAADGTPTQKLRELVETSNACSPVSCAMQDPIQLELRIECEDS